MFGHSSIDRRLVSVTAQGSMEAEQYQALRIKLERMARARDLKTIAITSPGARDGKTVTAINVAGALARGSMARVLLIEGDVRRPAVGRYLGLSTEHEPGLRQLVHDADRKLQDVVQKIDTLEFDLLLAGPMDVAVHDMFRSPRMQEILAEARTQYDFVIIDTPPLGPVSDCALLAPFVDGLLMVVAAHQTPRKMLEEALNQLDPASVLGIVFNRDDRPLFGYRNSYYRGYFPQTRTRTTRASASHDGVRL
jgi:capsular exopolysaccharide synthesis family protein